MNQSNLPSQNKKIYNDVPVLTTKELSEYYGVTEITITKNFNNNKNNYVENIDYFVLEGSSLSQWKSTTSKICMSSEINRINKLYLWTESGCLKHAKSIGTKEAWEVYNTLLKSYFTLKEIVETQKKIPQTFADALRAYADEVEQRELLQKQIEAEKPKVEAYETFLDTTNYMSIGEFANISNEKLKLGRNTIFRILRELEYLMKDNRPYQKYINQGLFAVKENIITHNSGKKETIPQTFVTKKGVNYLFERLKTVKLLLNGIDKNTKEVVEDIKGSLKEVKAKKLQEFDNTKDFINSLFDENK